MINKRSTKNTLLSSEKNWWKIIIDFNLFKNYISELLSLEKNEMLERIIKIAFKNLKWNWKEKILLLLHLLGSWYECRSGKNKPRYKLIINISG